MIQLPADASWETEDNDPSAWVSAAHVGDLETFQALGFRLAQPWLLRLFGGGNQQMEDVSLTLPFNKVKLDTHFF